MSKTYKKNAIFLITTLWLVLGRVLASVIDMGDYIGDWFFTAFVQIIGMGMIPLLLYRFWVKEDIIEGFSLHAKLPVEIYLWAVALGVLLIVVIRCVSVVSQTILVLIGYNPYSMATQTIYSSPWIFAADLICTAVLPAIFEELTYRGLGMSMLSGMKSDGAKIILMGALFGLGHQYVQQTVYAFAAGLLFAYVAIKTKSILPGMIMHFINNAFSVVLAYSNQKAGRFSEFVGEASTFFMNHVLLIVVLIGVVAALLYLILRRIKKITAAKASEEKEYVYPGVIKCVENIFGIGTPERVYRIETAWYDYACLYGSMIITIAVTTFTFLWGMWR